MENDEIKNIAEGMILDEEKNCFFECPPMQPIRFLKKRLEKEINSGYFTNDKEFEKMLILEYIEKTYDI